MKLVHKLKRFSRDEDGAVTVDWVVLTAAVVALGVGAISAIQTSTDGVTGKIATSLESVEATRAAPTN